VLPGKGEVAFVVEPAWGEPAWRLLEAAHSHTADLVVVGAESRHGLARLVHPPVASRLARTARDVPVVFVPAPSPADLVSITAVPRLFTVLAPTDLSAVGNGAIPFAYTLLAGHGGVVELCHVHERALPSPPYAYDRPQGRLADGQRAELQAALRALVPADADRLGITTHVSVIDGGEAAEAIVQAAERLAVDAIALGSHGRGGTARALMGSVAESVLRRAGRPVLVIPSGASERRSATGHR
jgi:nucleotide-binding universal stress UspA family protein